MDDDGVVDIVDRYCAQLPVAVISDILGVPDEDRPQILRFGELGAPSLDIGLTWRQYQEVNSGIKGFESWLTDHLRQLRRNPGEDLLSQIIQASDAGAAGEPLNEAELRALAGLVLAAGFETTVNLLGNGIRMLLDHPEHLTTLAARPELWPNTVEEILRLDSPVLMSARVARRDTEVAGTPVQAGELVIVHLAGANRDPAVFADPHRFDIERDNAGRAPLILRRPPLLPRRGPRAGRGPGRPADVLRPLPRRTGGGRRKSSRHPDSAWLVDLCRSRSGRHAQR